MCQLPSMTRCRCEQKPGTHAPERTPATLAERHVDRNCKVKSKSPQPLVVYEVIRSASFARRPEIVQSSSVHRRRWCRMMDPHIGSCKTRGRSKSRPPPLKGWVTHQSRRHPSKGWATHQFILSLRYDHDTRSCGDVCSFAGRRGLKARGSLPGFVRRKMGRRGREQSPCRTELLARPFPDSGAVVYI